MPSWGIGAGAVAAGQAMEDVLAGKAKEERQQNNAVVAMRIQFLIQQANKVMEQAAAMKQENDKIRTQGMFNILQAQMTQKADMVKTLADAQRAQKKDDADRAWEQQKELNRQNEKKTDQEIEREKIKAQKETEYARISATRESENSPFGGTLSDYVLSYGMEKTVDMLGNYQIDLPKGNVQRDPYYKMIQEQLFIKYPEWNQAEYQVRRDLIKGFTAGKESNMLVAFNAAINHLNNIYEASIDLENTGFSAWNTIKNISAKNVRGAGPEIQDALKRFQIGAKALPGELAGVYKGVTGSAPTDQEMKEWREVFRDSESPEQIMAGIDETLEYLFGKVGSLQDKWSKGMGKTTHEELPFLSPKSRKILEKFGHDPSEIDPMKPISSVFGGIDWGALFSQQPSGSVGPVADTTGIPMPILDGGWGE